jgi:membrane-bound lytic murein transglycosylase D
VYKKYIFIATALVLSGCQQTSVSLGNYSVDSASFSSYSTCETKTLKNKEFSSLWHRMRSGFCFNNVNSSRISQELKWMKRNKQFVYRSIERSKPYLFHILNYLEQKNLPHELALLPMVESGFQPFAYSASRAAGIWQFIPPTAREYGLKMNWHYDGRRDVLESTKAATYFLSDMHRHFKGNWLLAIASYNTGAGNVGKAIDRANNIFTKPSYWDLDLPRETELYVPRLLALAKIVNNPSKYGFKLANMENQNYTNKVNFRDPIDFQTLSVITGISEKELMNLNPGYSTWIIDPTQQNTLLLPNKEAKLFKERYDKISKIIYENKIYKVQKGDSLYKISRIYNVKINAIKKINALSSDIIYINQKIRIPSELSATNKEFITVNNIKYFINKKEVIYNHIIRRYDNWYKIARKYDVPLKKLLEWNNADKQTKLKINKLIKIKLRGPLLVKNKKMKTLRYVVNSGERYDQIIRGFSVSKDSLIKDNKLKNKKYLTAGDNLIINQN